MWQALRNFQALRVAAGGASVACSGAALSNLSMTAGHSLAPVALAAAAATFAAVAVAAHQIAQKFVSVGYRHYEHE